MVHQLATLTAGDVRRASASIWERLAQLPAFAAAGWLLVYISKGNEVDTHALIQQLLALGRHVCVPKFDALRQCYRAAELLDFHVDLEAGQYGILEPKADAIRFVPIDRLEAIVVPGLAFSPSGDRLGRGMGYFDRFLARPRLAAANVNPRAAWKIALAYEFQVVPVIALEVHDVPVDFIVTETRRIDCAPEANE